MKNILKISNVNKTYRDGKKALTNINLSVPKGGFIALLGPNGAGKSTLINIMSDVVVKSSGTLNLNGYDFDTHRTDFKKSIGIVPQDLNIDPFFNPLESLLLQQGLYGLKEDKDKAMETLEKVGLKDKAFTYTRNLSGGMKRRLLIAKAIIHDPELIILDEPTAGVDVDLRQHLWALLKSMNEAGKTIILTTHYLEEAEYLCDSVAIINHGQVVAYENKNALMSKVGSREALITTDKDDQILNTWPNTKKVEEGVIFNYKEELDLGKIISNICAEKASIQKIQIRESSLEDVFLELTK